VVLRLMEWRGGQYRPFTITSANDLFIAEILALLRWMEDNPEAALVLELAGGAPNHWSATLDGIGYVERPAMEAPPVPVKEPEGAVVPW
jgi:hypothetical protein